VSAHLQASLFHFFSSDGFQLEQFSVSKPSDCPQQLSERDFVVFSHVTFHQQQVQ
jgi:hypothetical protein